MQTAPPDQSTQPPASEKSSLVGTWEEDAYYGDVDAKSKRAYIAINDNGTWKEWRNGSLINEGSWSGSEASSIACSLTDEEDGENLEWFTFNLQSEKKAVYKAHPERMDSDEYDDLEFDRLEAE